MQTESTVYSLYCDVSRILIMHS